MKKSLRSLAWLLPLLISGCFHKAHQTRNPPVPPSIELPVPPAQAESTPSQTTPPAPTTAQQPAPESKPPAEETTPQPHHKKHASKPAPAEAPTPPPEPAGVSAIGNLSAGASSTSQQETEDSIASTERGLKSINRQLDDQEQKTAAQITEFLKQARSALGSGDVDGAHTLALKAKVLLSELSH